jgi:hypothetical protein
LRGGRYQYKKHVIMPTLSASDASAASQSCSSFVRVALAPNRNVFVHFDATRGTVGEVLAEALRLAPLDNEAEAAPYLVRRGIDGTDTRLDSGSTLKDSGVERCQLLLLRQDTS